MEEKIVKKTSRSDNQKKYLQKRLRVIEGQVRGIIQMIEDDRYCNDVLIQISAVNNSLKSLGNEMLKNHLSTCVVHDIKEDKLESIEEIVDLFKIIN